MRSTTAPALPGLPVFDFEIGYRIITGRSSCQSLEDSIRRPTRLAFTPLEVCIMPTFVLELSQMFKAYIAMTISEYSAYCYTLVLVEAFILSSLIFPI